MFSPRSENIFAIYLSAKSSETLEKNSLFGVNYIDCSEALSVGDMSEIDTDALNGLFDRVLHL